MNASAIRTRPLPLPPFEWVLAEHAGAVLSFLSRIAGADADDCFQETMLAALRAYPALEHGTNLRGWLLTIARRKAVDNHRASARRPVTVEEIDAAAHDHGADAPDTDLWEQVRLLPSKQRRAVGMRFVEDRSYEDIAGEMEISQDAARRNVHEGVKKLRRSLQ
ncbi:MAG: RNA polymerase sigma factor [Candidatus Dormibacteria bacterium]